MVKEERSAGAVVFYVEKGEPLYLLLHYPRGHLDFPKGNIEPGEKEEETALREVKEETGLDVELIPGFRETIRYFYKLHGETIRKTVVFFLARSYSKDVKISWEHKGYYWFPYHKAIKEVTFPSTREVLKKAHNFLNFFGYIQ